MSQECGIRQIIDSVNAINTSMAQQADGPEPSAGEASRLLRLGIPLTSASRERYRSVWASDMAERLARIACVMECGCDTGPQVEAQTSWLTCPRDLPETGAPEVLALEDAFALPPVDPEEA